MILVKDLVPIITANFYVDSQLSIEGKDVREFVTLCALDNIVENEHGAMIAGFEEKDVLVFGFFVVEDLVHFEGHGLAGPHVGDLAEPAI